MPKTGMRPIMAFICAISYTFSAGSPGPFESMTPSCPAASISSADVPCGYTVTAQPRFIRQSAMDFL